MNLFKSSLQDVEREYEVATLSFDGSKYSQATTGTIKDTEKVYIPTKTELEGVYIDTMTFKRSMFWTATPYDLSGYLDAYGSFGFFYSGYHGDVYESGGYYEEGALALFRIG